MTRTVDAIRMEWVRVVTARASYLVLFLAIVVSAVIAMMIALLAPPTPLSPSRTSAALTAGGDAVPLSIAGFPLALLGAMTVAHDYRYGLLRVVLVAQPRRGVVMAGRLAILAFVAVALGTSVSLVGAAACWIVGRAPAHDVTTLRVAAWHAAVCVLWSWLGAGLTWVLRNSAGTVSLLLVGPLFVEPGLAAIAEAEGGPETREAMHWLPFAAVRQALGRSLGRGPDTIGALAGLEVFAGVTLLVLVLAWLLVQRRDA